VSNGTLDASGTQTGDVGGGVQVLGTSTDLATTSVVDVSGEGGGGTVAIGTTLARAKGGPGDQFRSSVEYRARRPGGANLC
jgi:hypothetical protein